MLITRLLQEHHLQKVEDTGVQSARIDSSVVRDGDALRPDTRVEVDNREVISEEESTEEGGNSGEGSSEEGGGAESWYLDAMLNLLADYAGLQLNEECDWEQIPDFQVPDDVAAVCGDGGLADALRRTEQYELPDEVWCPEDFDYIWHLALTKPVVMCLMDPQHLLLGMECARRHVEESPVPYLWHAMDIIREHGPQH